MSDPERPTMERNAFMDTLSIAPSWLRALSYVGPVLVVLVILFGISIARQSGKIGISAALVVVFLAPIGVVWLWGHNTRLFVGSDYFGWFDIIGRRTVLPLTDLRRVIQRQVIIGAQRPAPTVYLLGGGNRVLYRFNRRVWDSEMVGEYLDRLQRRVEVDTTPIKAMDLKKELKRPNL